MLTFRIGAAGLPKSSASMAQYLANEPDVFASEIGLAAYYGSGIEADGETLTAAIPRKDMHPAIAALLGIDPRRSLSAAEVANLLTGLRTDGDPVPLKRRNKTTPLKRAIAYVEFAFGAPKSLSVSLALAPTEEEKAIHDRIHREAVNQTMAIIARDIGIARIAAGGSEGHDEGHIAWIEFNHHTSRPTLLVPRVENGLETTERVSVKVAGDPHRHTHVIVPNAVVTNKGRVTSFHLAALDGRVHEYGAIYQAFIVAGAKRYGIRTELDKTTWMGRYAEFPRSVERLYSKRSEDGEAAAKRIASQRGLDWETMTADEKISLVRGQILKRRQSKKDGDPDGSNDLAEWQRQAEDANYQHKSVLHPEEAAPLASREVRREAAYQASLDYLEEQIGRRSKFEGSLARIAAAKGLISTGIEDIADVNAITAAYRTEGVRQAGEMTALRWGRDGDSRFASFTTSMHLAEETRAIELLSTAAADRSQALTVEQINQAIARVSAERGLDFTSEHGLLQRKMMLHLGAGGRVVVGIGVAGSGKTALLSPLIDAWQQDDRTTYGVTLAWRQTKGLADAGVSRRKRKVADTRLLREAGVAEDRAMALARFLFAPPEGLDARSVVIIDEIANIGTNQIWRLAVLQDKIGFSIVGIGDQEQCQSIEAGNTIRLFQKALGEEQVPQILNSIRAVAERDRVTSALFREGNAAEALERKQEDGTLRIIAGGYAQAVTSTVDLYEARVQAAPRLGYSIAISAPTNTDARAISAEIRRRRQKRGEVGANQMDISAIDGTNTRYTLPLAHGDRVRLFTKVTIRSEDGRTGRFGENGSVVQVLSVDEKGMRAENAKGRIGFVPWERLRDKKTGLIKLSYGDAVTIDARQGDTVDEHITAMPGGSKLVNGYKINSADSRYRIQGWIVASEGQELLEVMERRPLGDPRNFERDPQALRRVVVANMARNLSDKPRKVLATDFIATAHHQGIGTVNAKRASWHLPEAARATPADAKRLRNRWKNNEAVMGEMARRSAPQPTVKPRPNLTPRASFAEELGRIGLVVKGEPLMDGRLHYVPVVGAKRGDKRGTYQGFADGNGGWGVNHKTGERMNWQEHNGHDRPVDNAERQARIAAERVAREAEQRRREDAGADEAMRIWAAAHPAKRHPYLDSKRVPAMSVRIAGRGETVTMEDESKIDIGGNLLIPMHDKDGKLWNLQRINDRGRKYYLSGRKHGLFTQLGVPSGNDPIVIAEGYATAATLMQTTALSSVVAFDASSLVPVALAIRNREPTRPIIFAADNDHHRPGVVRNVAANDTGRLTVQWAEGATGLARLGNTIEYRIPGQQDYAVAATEVSGTSYALSGLQPNARYDVRIYATHQQRALPNIGVEKAREAAALVGGTVLVPHFAEGARGTDWNDYARANGAEAIRAALRENGIRVTPTRQVRRPVQSPTVQPPREAPRLSP